MPNKKGEKMSENNLVEYTLKIDGMKCGMCESHVNDVIRRVNGVKKVISSHTKGNSVVIMEKDTSKEDIKAAVNKEGYKVLSEDEKPYVKRGLFSIFKK